MPMVVRRSQVKKVNEREHFISNERNYYPDEVDHIHQIKIAHGPKNYCSRPTEGTKIF